MDVTILLYFGGGFALAIVLLWFMECHERDIY